MLLKCIAFFTIISTIYSLPRSDNWNWFSTKTSYKDALEWFSKQNYLKSISKSCEPQLLYLVSRHASRYPDSKMIKDMQLLYSLRDKLIVNSDRLLAENFTEQDLIQLKNWKLHMKPSDGKNISISGHQEASNFGKRLYKKFPLMFNQSHSNISIGVTYKQRTKDTAKAFLSQINEKGLENISLTTQGFLITDKQCKDHFEKKGVRPSIPNEYNQFIQSDSYKQMLARLAYKLSIPIASNDTLLQAFKLIYNICIYENALYDQSVWCLLFSNNDFKMIEYMHDLKNYFSSAHGKPSNGLMTCPFLQDLLQKIENVKMKPGTRSTTLTFTHSRFMKTLFTMFGLFSKFGSSFCRSNDKCIDEWRSSLVVPFLANVNFVLYECSDTDDQKQKKIGVFVQEHLVRVQGCDHDLCDLTQFISMYKNYTQNCSLDFMCISESI